MAYSAKASTSLTTKYVCNSLGSVKNLIVMILEEDLRTQEALNAKAKLKKAIAQFDGKPEGAIPNHNVATFSPHA